MRFNLFFSCFIFLFSCTVEEDSENISKEDFVELKNERTEIKDTTDAQQSKEKTTISSKYRYEIFASEHGGFGYDIFEGDKRLIHQPHIPAVQGMKGFIQKDFAKKVAQEIINKLDQGIMPPTLSIDEMRKLGVI